MKRPDQPKKPTSSAAQRTNVLLENIAAEFRTFGEGLAAVRSDVASVKIVVERLDTDMEFLVKPTLKSLNKDMAEVKADVATLKTDMKDVKTQLGTLNDRLSTVEIRTA